MSDLEDALEELLLKLGAAERALEEKISAAEYRGDEFGDVIADELRMRLEDVQDRIRSVENKLYGMRR